MSGMMKSERGRVEKVADTKKGGGVRSERMTGYRFSCPCWF